MLARIIDWSIGNRLLVVLGALLVAAAGVFSLARTPIDAIPDLSDVQVIIQTEYPGQAPRIVEDQVTYPLTTQMLGAPFAKVVRGYSFFGVSFVYVIFEDGTDLYWARSRVLEYLNSIAGQLPPGVTPEIGPDATGVGWAFMYALHSDRHDLGELRSIQDWFLKYELTAVPGVSEVASVGGFVRQYQVTVDPNRLRAYGVPISAIRTAIQENNSDAGGGLVEVAEKEFMIRGLGYIRSVDDIGRIGLGVGADGTPILLQDVARVSLGPEEPAGAGGVERRGGDGRRHRRGAARGGHAKGDPRREGQAGRDRAGIARRRRDRGRLRPHLADRPRGREHPDEPRAAAADRGGDVPGLPLPPSERAGGRDRAAGGDSAGDDRGAPAGADAQHHVAGGDRGGDRDDGRRRNRDGRERAQASGAARRAQAALGDHRAGGEGGGPVALLRAARDHGVVHAGVHAGGAGREALQAACLHEDVRDGGGRAALGDAGPCAGGILGAGQDPAGGGDARGDGCWAGRTGRCWGGC